MIFTIFCRTINKNKTIVEASIINSIILLFCVYLLLVKFNMGLYGYLIAFTVGQVISPIYVFIKAKLYKYITITIDVYTIKRMVIYSMPLILNELAWWINNASDRYIVTWFCGASIGGIYAVSYKIPNILNNVQTVFSQAWSISAIKEFNENDEDGFIGNTYKKYLFIMMISCSLCIFLNKIISKILFSNEFFYAWKYVPPLLVAFVLNGSIRFFGNILTAVKDTKCMSISTLTASIINVIGNIILIPIFGAYIATITTLFSSLVNYIIRIKVINKYISMKYEAYKEYISFLIIFIQMIFATIFSEKYILQIICMMCLIILNKDTVSNLKDYVLDKIYKRI